MLKFYAKTLQEKSCKVTWEADEGVIVRESVIRESPKYVSQTILGFVHLATSHWFGTPKHTLPNLPIVA